MYYCCHPRRSKQTNGRRTCHPQDQTRRSRSKVSQPPSSPFSHEQADDNISILYKLCSLLLATFMGQSLIFLASMVMIRLDGFTGQNNISVCITLLLSIKSHLHPSICNMNPFNGYVGTSRLMQSQTGQIFSNTFCNDLALVLLMTSHERPPKFYKMAL